MIPFLDPCKGTEANSECTVIQGQMMIVAQESDGLQLMSASILDALQAAYDDRGLLVPNSATCNDDPICIFNKIEWLGATVDEAITWIEEKNKNNEPEPAEDRSVAGAVQQTQGDERKTKLVFIAAVPIAILAAFGLLLARSKRGREVKTAAQLEDIDQDHVIVGTGDPPRCFHDGLYHYTRSGARYLSTNCADCAETRRIGFFTDGDLPPIHESASGESYDSWEDNGENSYNNAKTSYDTSETGRASNRSMRRKQFLVPASPQDLGNKSSTVDVHHCTSATCPICSYRPQDVSFVSSPVGSPARETTSRSENLGDTCVV